MEICSLEQDKGRVIESYFSLPIECLANVALVKSYVERYGDLTTEAGKSKLPVYVKKK